MADNDEAVQSIAPWLNGFAYGCGGGEQTDGGIYAAEQLIEAFTEDEFAIVKLPEPDSSGTDNHGGSWTSWPSGGAAVQPAGKVLVYGKTLAPDEAREAAAEILAAADAAEADR